MTSTEIIQAIKAEIERRLKHENEILWNAKLRGTTYSPSVDVNLLTLTSLRDFISTLESEKEQPDFPTTNEHMKEFLATHPKVEVPQKYKTPDWIFEQSEKPMNPEDAMKELDEKIALVKKRGTWDGVDVDKYMDEVRGREPEKLMQEGLEEEIQGERKKLIEAFGPMNGEQVIAIKDFARHFAEWGAEHAKNRTQNEHSK